MYSAVDSLLKDLWHALYRPTRFSNIAGIIFICHFHMQSTLKLLMKVTILPTRVQKPGEKLFIIILTTVNTKKVFQ